MTLVTRNTRIGDPDSNAAYSWNVSDGGTVVGARYEDTDRFTASTSNSNPDLYTVGFGANGTHYIYGDRGQVDIAKFAGLGNCIIDIDNMSAHLMSSVTNGGFSTLRNCIFNFTRGKVIGGRSGATIFGGTVYKTANTVGGTLADGTTTATADAANNNNDAGINGGIRASRLMGEWSATAGYIYGDKVLFEGQVYIMITPTFDMTSDNSALLVSSTNPSSDTTNWHISPSNFAGLQGTFLDGGQDDSSLVTNLNALNLSRVFPADDASFNSVLQSGAGNVWRSVDFGSETNSQSSQTYNHRITRTNNSAISNQWYAIIGSNMSGWTATGGFNVRVASVVSTQVLFINNMYTMNTANPPQPFINYSGSPANTARVDLHVATGYRPRFVDSVGNPLDVSTSETGPINIDYISTASLDRLWELPPSFTFDPTNSNFGATLRTTHPTVYVPNTTYIYRENTVTVPANTATNPMNPLDASRDTRVFQYRNYNIDWYNIESEVNDQGVVTRSAGTTNTFEVTPSTIGINDSDNPEGPFELLNSDISTTEFPFNNGITATQAATIASASSINSLNELAAGLRSQDVNIGRDTSLLPTSNGSRINTRSRDIEHLAGSGNISVGADAIVFATSNTFSNTTGFTGIEFNNSSDEYDINSASLVDTDIFGGTIVNPRTFTGRIPAGDRPTSFSFDRNILGESGNRTTIQVSVPANTVRYMVFNGTTVSDCTLIQQGPGILEVLGVNMGDFFATSTPGGGSIRDEQLPENVIEPVIGEFDGIPTDARWYLIDFTSDEGNKITDPTSGRVLARSTLPADLTGATVGNTLRFRSPFPAASGGNAQVPSAQQSDSLYDGLEISRLASGNNDQVLRIALVVYNTNLTSSISFMTIDDTRHIRLSTLSPTPQVTRVAVESQTINTFVQPTATQEFETSITFASGTQSATTRRPNLLIQGHSPVVSGERKASQGETNALFAALRGKANYGLGLWNAFFIGTDPDIGNTIYPSNQIARGATAWDSSQAYSIGDPVLFNNRGYEAVVDITAGTTSNPEGNTDWMEFSVNNSIAWDIINTPTASEVDLRRETFVPGSADVDAVQLLSAALVVNNDPTLSRIQPTTAQIVAGFTADSLAVELLAEASIRLVGADGQPINSPSILSDERILDSSSIVTEANRIVNLIGMPGTEAGDPQTLFTAIDEGGGGMANLDAAQIRQAIGPLLGDGVVDSDGDLVKPLRNFLQGVVTTPGGVTGIDLSASTVYTNQHSLAVQGSTIQQMRVGPATGMPGFGGFGFTADAPGFLGFKTITGDGLSKDQYSDASDLAVGASWSDTAITAIEVTNGSGYQTAQPSINNLQPGGEILLTDSISTITQPTNWAFFRVTAVVAPINTDNPSFTDSTAATFFRPDIVRVTLVASGGNIVQDMFTFTSRNNGRIPGETEHSGDFLDLNTWLQSGADVTNPATETLQDIFNRFPGLETNISNQLTSLRVGSNTLQDIRNDISNFRTASRNPIAGRPLPGDS